MYQCCGSVTFWFGSRSGSAGLYHWVTDPDPALFAGWLSKYQSKKIFSLFYFYFLKVHLHHSFKIKSHKEVTKYYTQKFFLLFSWYFGRIRIRTNNDGSGFGRFKTIPILLIRILECTGTLMQECEGGGEPRGADLQPGGGQRLWPLLLARRGTIL